MLKQNSWGGFLKDWQLSWSSLKEETYGLGLCLTRHFHFLVHDGHNNPLSWTIYNKDLAVAVRKMNCAPHIQDVALGPIRTLNCLHTLCLWAIYSDHTQHLLTTQQFKMILPWAEQQQLQHAQIHILPTTKKELIYPQSSKGILFSWADESCKNKNRRKTTWYQILYIFSTLYILFHQRKRKKKNPQNLFRTNQSSMFLCHS